MVVCQLSERVTPHGRPDTARGVQPGSGTSTAKRPAALGYAGAGPAPLGTEGGQSGLKVLVQHLYPGRSRNQGVAHGTVSTIASHGARRGEPHVGRGV